MDWPLKKFRKHFLPAAMLLSVLTACQPSHPAATAEQTDTTAPPPRLFTAYSDQENRYRGFDAPRAINRLADLENVHFRAYRDSVSRYYGTLWRDHDAVDSTGKYAKYVQELGAKGDSMHCTIYAVAALKAGLGEAWSDLEAAHRRKWKAREHAGWSIGYLLVTEYGWQASLVLDKTSPEYQQCIQAYHSRKEYPVWRQPNIPLENLWVRGEDDSLIQAKLAANEFGWGFSHQGIHTWVTRFGELKECNWAGAPAGKYELYHVPLFEKTPFLEFSDYASHVLIFPPLK